MKNNKIFIIVVILVGIITSTITAYATSYLYASNEVSYDNTNSGISATNVQGAINELYDAAQDYSSINTRVSTLESKWEYSGRWLTIKEATVENRGVRILDNNNKERGRFFYEISSDAIGLYANNSSETWGQGTLNLMGNPVNINGKEAAVKPTITILLNQKAVPITATSYSCNWSSYDFLILCAVQYDNILETLYIPTSYFNGTNAGSRTLLHNTWHDQKYEIYKNGNSAVYLKNDSTVNDNMGVRIYGVKF